MFEISPIPLNIQRFADFGDVLSFDSVKPQSINRGQCSRFTDLACLGHERSGRLGISLFQSKVYNLPHAFSFMERHPLGPQAFFPVDQGNFLILVAHDRNGVPDKPQAFISAEYMGVNIHRGVWHGVLTPISGKGKFIVFDWIGDGPNLEEYMFDTPWTVPDTISLFP